MSATDNIPQSPISPKRIGETWRDFLAALSSDELCELDRLIHVARLVKDARIVCDDAACGCRR